MLVTVEECGCEMQRIERAERCGKRTGRELHHWRGQPDDFQLSEQRCKRTPHLCRLRWCDSSGVHVAINCSVTLDDRELARDAEAQLPPFVKWRRLAKIDSENDRRVDVHNH